NSFQDNCEDMIIESQEKIDISAMEEGVVIFAGNVKHTDQTVVIQHTNGSQTTYGHLESMEVHLYQFIESNQVIGQFTPSAENEWVYFSIKKDNQYIDPAQVIKVDDSQ